MNSVAIRIMDRAAMAIRRNVNIFFKAFYFTKYKWLA
jgi:hypothetical protein